MRLSFFCPLFVVLMFITVGYVTADLAEGLVVYLTFDNVKGKRILDESGNGLDAEIIKDTKFVKGKYGKAIRITNETEDCVNIPSTDALEISGEITMMAWVYQDDWTGSTSQWFDKGSYSVEFNSLYGMAVFDKNDAPGIAVFPNGSGVGIILGRQFPEPHERIVIANKMRNRTWHHIVGICEDSSVRMYLDGENIFGFNQKKPFDFNGINKENLRIGCAKGRPQYAFEGGCIDEVAIWSRTLSETEIRTALRGNLLAVSPKDKIATTWGNIKRKVFQL